MANFKKVILVAFFAAMMTGCIEDQANSAGYGSHHGYQRYQANNVNSGYNSHYNASNQQNGGYQKHNGNNRWYRTARTNQPPLGYNSSSTRSAHTSGANTYSTHNGSGQNGYQGSNAAPPSSTSGGYQGR